MIYHDIKYSIIVYYIIRSSVLLCLFSANLKLQISTQEEELSLFCTFDSFDPQFSYLLLLFGFHLRLQ